MNDPEYCFYILLNEAEEALYCGITIDADRRYQEHMTNQPWADEIHSVIFLPLIPVCSSFTGREYALAVEKHLIKLIKPKYNVTHNLDRILADKAEIQMSRDAFISEYMCA